MSSPKGEQWMVEHFAQALPKGREQGSVPKLLRHVAESIASKGNIEVQDLIMHIDVNEYGLWPSLTVYFTRPETSDE